MASQSWASFLALFLPLPCLQSKKSEARKATPSSALMLAAIATPLSEDDGDGAGERLVVGRSDGDTKFAADTVVVFVAMIVAVTVSGRLGDVEPDVRLYITNPAFTENGATLPLVGT